MLERNVSSKGANWCKFVVFGAILMFALLVALANFDVARADELATLDISGSADAGLELESASSTTKGTNTKVTLGSGVVGTKKFTVDQKSARSTSLKRLRAWRKDALGDSRIKVDGLTIKQWLKKNGVSQKTYLNPNWSNALERIAVQRAVEAGDANLGHTRPNGSSCFTATYKGISAGGEVLAWSAGSMTGGNAVDMWASEKADYIKKLRGQKHGQTGHYETLINPNFKAYGFAVTQGYTYKSVAAGEAASKRIGSAKGTNWKGRLYFDIAIDNAKVVSPGISLNMFTNSKTVNIGTAYPLKATFNYRNGTFTVREKWYSSNSKVLKVSSNGNAKGVKAGKAKIYFVGQYSAAVSVEITVPKNVQVYRLCSKYTGEHFYTRNNYERYVCVNSGWNNEGIAWNSPVKSSKPVYRLCNKTTGLHLFTTNKNEYKYLGKHGWRKEGMAFYSATKNKQKIYRLCNNSSGQHLLTANRHEYKTLKRYGWTQEGIGCYGTI